MNLHRLVTLLFAVTALSYSLAASADAGARIYAIQPINRYFQESWTTRDGLPHNTVNSLAQTPEGYIWLTTWEGVARFNGSEFKVFGRDRTTGLPDAGMRSTHVDKTGRLILGGSRGGLTSVTHHVWQPLQAVGGLVNDIVAEDDGSFWVATEGDGLYREYSDGRREQWTVDNGMPSNSVYTLAKDAKGELWIGTSKGAVVFDKQQFHLNKAIPAVPVFDVLPIANGYLVATEFGLLQCDTALCQQYVPKLANIAVSELMFDHQGSLWIGTIERGVYRFSEPFGLEHLETDREMPRNRVLSLLQDKEKSIWIGTNGGLLRLRDVPFSTVTESQGLAGNYVRSVLADQDDHSMWIGSSNGLSRYDITTDKVVESLIPKQSVLSLAQQTDGTLYIGTYTSGVFVYKNGKVTLLLDRQHGLISNEVRAISLSKDGSLWVGTSQGLSILKDGKLQNITTADGLPGNFIVAMAQVDDQVWIGTGTGITKWAHGKFNDIAINHFDNAEYAFGFYHQSEKQLLWGATDRGLMRHNLATGETQVIGRKDGLPFDKYFQVYIDDKHDMWMSSNRGILRFSEADANAVFDGKLKRLPIVLYGESDGLISAQANGGSSPTIAKSTDGSLWMSTARGVARVDPNRLYLFSQYTPNVEIENVALDGEAQLLSHAITIAPEVQRIEVRYAGLSYIMPSRILYRTRLQGFDQVWRENGNQHQIEFTNLAPGKYQLEIQAQNPGGEWSTPATLQIIKQPFWWQTTWVSYLALLGLLLLIGAIVLWRTHSLRRSRAKLLHLVELKTEELRRHTTHLAELNNEKSELLEMLRHQALALEKQAMQDELTGLPNRRSFDETFAREFSRAKRSGQPLALAFLDIDHFKRINDTLSHEAGDTALELLAEQLKAHCREFDVCARWGGEEFVMLLPATTLEQARRVSERLRYGVAAMDCNDIAPQLSITVSIGVACSDAAETSAELLNQADKALYRAKQSGRNRVELADPHADLG
ncbi:diguanylate cyclase [Shewanella avicenniae]|uniref:diguanylate cyclase n=1 Tax=Shewanella avicenniae TaxID=2814294 RepID=A0ABX7QVE6_9GAMM|nr:ligand-binding sensor domain-containing diguanylate cyclase [Shewanella avicenniae]QSX34798.1 diguanylate cyclase [Shewanella avicenniae]